MLDINTIESPPPTIPDDSPDDNLIRSRDLLRKLGGISYPTLWRWMKRRRFPQPAMRIGQVNYWRLGDVRRWIAENREAV